MAAKKPTVPNRPVPLDYRAAGNDVRHAARRTRIAWILAGLICALLFISLLFTPHTMVRPAALQAHCRENFKKIAAAMMEYANTHRGAYPNSMEDLVSSGMNSASVICPASNDTQATQPSELTDLSITSGHCSYIYLAKGLKGGTPPNMVLAYEPLANHNNKGMHILTADYRVIWLTPAEGKQFIASIAPGKLAVWPVSGR